jgi:diacylglycerol O-acyltransferase / wax synthase
MERLSALDGALLSSERANQQLNVLAILIMEPDPEIDRVDYYQATRDRVQERLPLVPVLRRRLRPLLGLANPIWEDDPAVVIDAHIHQAVLEPPGDIHALGKIAGEITARPLSRERPMWELWLVTGLEDGNTAFMCKVHHALLDGASGLGSLAAFFDFEPHGEPMAVPPATFRPPLSTRQLLNESLDAADLWRQEFLKEAPRVVDLVRFVMKHARNPDRDPALALPFTGPRLKMSGPLTARRAVSLTSLELSRLKPLKRAFGVTLNDILVALCAGTLRAYLKHTDESRNRPLVAAIPVSERQLDDAPEGNKFSSMFYNIPVHIEDPVERVRFTARSALLGKEFYDQVGRQSLQSLAALAPPLTVGPAMGLLSAVRKVTDVIPPVMNLMISNVRGVDFPLWVAGGKVVNMLPMGPLMEGAGLNITMASYLDSVNFGFQACPDLVPDLDVLADGIHDALSELDKVAPVS